MAKVNIDKLDALEKRQLKKLLPHYTINRALDILVASVNFDASQLSEELKKHWVGMKDEETINE